MKILFLSNSGFSVYKFRKELIYSLIDLGNEVYLASPYDKYVEYLKNKGCKYINVEFERRKINLFSESKLIVRYKGILAKLKPNLVMSLTIKPNIYGGLISRLMKIPFIPNITGIGSTFYKSKMIKRIIVFIYRIALKRAKCVFFENNSNLLLFQKNKIVFNNVKLVPGSGVNVEEYSFRNYPGDGKLFFLFSGRIMKEKGIDEFLQAAHNIKKKHQNVYFFIIGSLEENYKKKIDAYEDNKIVKYYGNVKDVRPYIEKSHAVILPSYHEGLSNSLIEAAAMGRPVIASDIPGCRETFDEGVTGFKFEAKNIFSLEKAIERFIELPHKNKEKMGSLGRQKIVNEFDRKIVTKAYLDCIYNESN